MPSYALYCCTCCCAEDVPVYKRSLGQFRCLIAINLQASLIHKEDASQA